MRHSSFIKSHPLFYGIISQNAQNLNVGKKADATEIVAAAKVRVSCDPTESIKDLFPEEYGEDDECFEDEETEQAYTCSGRKLTSCTVFRTLSVV